MVGGEGVAAHDVELDQLRPPLIAVDPGLPGVAGRGDFARCGLRSRPAQIPARHQISARSPTWVGWMRSTRGSRPDRVCIRVSKQTRWMRCRDRTHHARRTMNRRVHGSTVTAVAVTVKMTTAQVSGDRLGQFPAAGGDGGEGGQFGAEPPQGPGGAVMHPDERPVQDVGVVAVVPGRRLRHGDHPARRAGSHTGHAPALIPAAADGSQHRAVATAGQAIWPIGWPGCAARTAARRRPGPGPPCALRRQAASA